MQKKTKITGETMILVLLTAILTILYISLIFNQNIWTDEAFTIQLTRCNTLSGIISGTANDVHPPLYYLITKLLISLFGSSFQIYKLVSILPMFLTMLLSVIYVRPWFGFRTALLFLLFLNGIPCVMEYGVQIRMYSWCIFFLTLAGLSAYGSCTKGTVKHWCILSLSSLCACYTHNFAMISAVFLYLILGISLIIAEKKFPVRFLISGIFVAICFVPWLFVLFVQTKNRVGNYWIEPISPETVIGYFGDLFGSRLPYTAVMFGVLLILALVLPKRTRQIKYFSIALILIPLFTALVGILISVLITPFFIARYLIPCMGLAALFLAIGFGGLEKNTVSQALLCLFLTTMIGSSYDTNYLAEYRSTHTAELLHYLEENMSPNDKILYNNQPYGFIYQCYFDSGMLCFLNDMDFTSDYDTIWYFDSCVDPWLPDTVLEEHGLNKEYIATLGIEQNDFILYKINKKQIP